VEGQPRILKWSNEREIIFTYAIVVTALSVCDVKFVHHALHFMREDSMTTARIEEEDEVILVDLQPVAGVL